MDGRGEEVIQEGRHGSRGLSGGLGGSGKVEMPSRRAGRCQGPPRGPARVRRLSGGLEGLGRVGRGQETFSGGGRLGVPQ